MAQHISIRVPWHDNGWNGSICRNPSLNSSCLRLKNIISNRDDEFEDSVCNQCISGKESQIPCVSESGAFMSEDELHKSQIHPYKDGNPETHGHFLETEVTYPPYTFPGRPYSWLMYTDKTEHTNMKAKIHGIKYMSDAEPNLCWNGRRPIWVQEACNQKAIFDYFFQDVIPGESLCIAYAKQIPFVEDRRRVVIGIGHVTGITPAVEHKHTSEGKLRSMTWETMVSHSIRSDNKDGFILPYEKMQKYADEHPEFDFNSIVVFAPDEAFDEFSYATEHVKYDSVIDVLLSCIKSYKIIEKCLNTDYSCVIEWLREQITNAWKERGLFPGLGVMFYTLGIQLGIPLGRYVRKTYNDSDQIWEYIDFIISTPEVLPKDIALSISETVKETWRNMHPHRKKLFKLLSRFDLEIDQADVLFHESLRKKNRIELTDSEIIENPYAIYEKTRLKGNKLCISVKQIDRAVFPDEIIRNILPLDEPTRLVSPNDKRRVRAMLIHVLEQAAESGHTIYPVDLALEQLQNMTSDSDCLVNEDILFAMDQYLKPEILRRSFRDGAQYFKLDRINKFDSKIKRVVIKRSKTAPLTIQVDTGELINKTKSLPNLSEGEKNLAIRERTEILQKIAESRFFVLVGNAGTGKTTLLSYLCSQKDIVAGGIWLIAPTGKATVRLSEKVKEITSDVRSYNAAQFLLRDGRYDKDDKRFYLKGETNPEITDQSTVIIDEASMFTTEMMGSLFESVGEAKRIILVGDPNQLPPIGAGRPFVDIIDHLTENIGPFEIDEPIVCKNYGELKVNIRQQSNHRSDVVLSQRFTNRECQEYEDNEILNIIQNDCDNISFIRWETRDELEFYLLKSVSEILGMDDVDDQMTFDTMLGANVDQETFFNVECAEYINMWQVLCPVRNMPQGVININRLFHNKYRTHQIELSKKKGYEHRIPSAFGSDGIVYGDKVINLKNSAKNAYPYDKNLNYVANGEIGIVCECYSGKGKTSDNNLRVCFSTQKGHTYSYSKNEYNEESSEDVLELAYALTVHKAQGSQFENVILVIAEPCRLLSRELLYTALTRQEANITVLYNQAPSQLLQYASVGYSDIAKRLTDLFAGDNYVPQIRKVGNSYYDEYKIHVTVEGELVQSKSEAHIANALHYNGIKYKYEQPLELDGITYYPDFTIKDPDTGEVWYWEHCGMMSDEGYVNRWQKKEALYAKHGITRDTNLIVTEERNGEGLNTQAIDELIKEKFMLE